MKKIFVTILLAFAVQFSFGQIEFIQEDWEQAIKKSQETGKPIFVDFYTDWCSWCKVMDNKTFSNDSVIKFMNDNYVALKIDAEKGMGVNLAMKYRIFGFPTFGIFSPNQRLVNKIVGYREVEPFLSDLDTNLKQVQEGYVVEGSSEDMNLIYPDFYVKSFKNKDSKKKKVWPKDSIVHEYLRGADLMDEVVFNVMCKFGGDEESNSNALAMQDQLAQHFGRGDVQRIMGRIAYRDYKKIEKEGTYDELQGWFPKLDMLMREDAAVYRNHYEVSFLWAKEMWTQYATKIDTMLANDKASTNFMNSQCWNIYKKVDNKDLVKKATTWMEKVVEKEANYMYVDTYAAVLYKDKQYAKAEEQAVKAIEIGTKSGEDVKDTEALLKDIRKAKS